MENMEFDIEFTDVTLVETDGDYKETKTIMKNEFPYNDKWVLRSIVTVASLTGIGIMEIQFYGNGDVYILDYKASIGDLFYNPDIEVISVWAQDNGWNIPQPHQDLVKVNKIFWKHFWETLIIDSDYLDGLYGVRPQLNIKSDKKSKKS